MASNSFGTVFRITTFGESHGPLIGVVIDGCPAGLVLNQALLQQELSLRAPGHSAYTSPRREPDRALIQSGIFEGKTTGAPLAILIANQDADPSQYQAIKSILRPGHANFSYLEKYGVFDYRGGGRASARETVARVAAGAVAKQLLASQGIFLSSFLSQVAAIAAENYPDDIQALQDATLANAIFCPDEIASQQMQNTIQTAKTAGDSLGGIVSFLATGLPAGLGDPLYEKLEAKLASAMMSIPASKGFEIGEGFAAASLTGSQHNDGFGIEDGQAKPLSNHAGGILGGISTGMPLFGRVAFKPTSSIQLPQASVNLSGKAATFTLPPGARHDPCVAIRAVPVVSAMLALVLADCYLQQRLARV